METNDVYLQLIKRMNRFESKYPPVEAYFKILKLMCTEEEAEFMSKFPENGHMLDDISKIYQKDKSELLPFINGMIYKGFIFPETLESGDRTYALFPLIPGAVENYILRRLDKKVEIRAITELFEALAIESAAEIERLKKEDPEKANAFISKEKNFRTIILNSAIPDNKKVYPYEDIIKMVDKYTSFAATLCTCKEGFGPATTGEPCKYLEKVPRHHCLQFGKVADYVMENNVGDSKRISKEECLEILDACNKAGLVQNVNNFIEDLHFICNCCPCCCAIIKEAKMLGPSVSNMVDPTNFLPAIDQDLCTGCGECADKCPVEAISLKEDVAVFNKDKCLGCGICATICPIDSITMERIANKKVELRDRKIGFGIG